MVEKKEIAIVFKREKTQKFVEKYHPYKVIVGRFDKKEKWFVESNGTVYHHISEYMNSGNCYGIRLPLDIFLKDGSKLNTIKKDILFHVKKFEYTRNWNKSYKIMFKDLKTKKKQVFNDVDTEEIYKLYEQGIPKTSVEEQPQKEEIIDNKEDVKIQIPKEIVDKIKETIKGQDESIETIVTTICTNKQFPQINKKNLLVTGPTGSGKTAIFRLLSEILDMPLIIFSVPGLTQSGFVGRSVDDIFVDLLLLCENDKHKAENAIVILDEIDKIANKSVNSGEIATEAVQNELLKVIEGEQRTIKLPRKETLTTIDTSKITFVGTGAFSELYANNKIERKQVGFITEPKNNSKKESKNINTEKLANYGLKRELLGRLPVLLELNTLTEEDLKDIILNSKESELKKIIKIFESYDIQCTNIDLLVDKIAKNAIEKGLGARGLTTVTTEIFTKIFYEILNNPTAYSELILGENLLEDKSDYVLVKKQVKVLKKTQ